MAADATLVGTHDTPCHDTLVPDPNRGAVMMTGEDQIAIENVGASYFLKSPELQRGVDDVRRGRPPSFDRAGQNRRDRIDFAMGVRARTAVSSMCSRAKFIRR